MAKKVVKKEVVPVTVETTVEQPKKRGGFIKFLFGCGFLLLLFMVLIGGGVALGVYGYPKAIDFVQDRGLSGFFGLKEDSKGEIIIPGTKREIITEESAIINVVEDSQSAVVSVAISSATFDPDQGVVNNTNEIGTGFFVDSKGVVATNQHVVSVLDAQYVIVTSEGKELAVEKIIRDDVNDIALLVVKKGNYPSLTLGDSDSLKVGQMVVAIGTPLGEYPGSVSQGIISGLKRTVSTNSGDFFRGTVRKYENVIQTDAAINPGNSGGPLLDLDGNVIGVNFAKTAADNISFALPVSLLKSRLDEFNKFGKFLRPYLGVRYQLISEEEASLYRNVVPGAFVQFVETNSPAEKVGIKKADIISKIDGVDASTNFAAIIQEKKIGQKVTLDVYRDGKTIKIDVVLTERED
jgi:serine protease Do